jgi:hypothetical protein
LSVQVERVQCPYCERQAASPGGVRFHVKLDHPEKLEDFMSRLYPAMVERFREKRSDI